MPPKITRVRWKAENVPWGVSFNEQTGTFTGTPDDIGEYVVPVTVETNYGTDTKDVKIIVEPPTYSVYAIGTNAATWSKNASPDTYGFRLIDIPKMVRLSSWGGGFRAYRPNGTAYGCGYTQAWWGIYDGAYWETDETPVSGVSKGVGYFTSKSASGSASEGTTKTLIRVIVPEGSGNASLTINTYYTLLINGSTPETFKGTTKNAPSSFRTLGIWSVSSNGISYLSEDGLRLCRIYYDINVKTNTTTVTQSETEIGYKAIKLVAGAFTYLSEDYYLDNNPDNFTHGVIKDAWHSGSTYVQTTDNRLYVYNSGVWDLLGTYEVKKAENSFVLMEDGGLYHKGSAVSGVTEAHSEFTRIFPELNFIDFTFSGNTLTVLRE